MHMVSVHSVMGSMGEAAESVIAFVVRDQTEARQLEARLSHVLDQEDWYVTDAPLVGVGTDLDFAVREAVREIEERYGN